MANWRRILEATIDKGKTSIYWNKSLVDCTTFRIGGISECFVVANSNEDIKKIIGMATREKILLFVIGNGSNLLISDQGLEGITLKLGSNYSYIKQNGNTLLIGAATSLSRIVNYTYLNSLSGLEFLCGIPGTLGGAIASNAGAFSQNIGQKIKLVYGITVDGKEIVLNRAQLKFSYRKTELPTKFIITQGVMDLIPSTSKEIKRQIKSYLKIRKEKQPWGASAGSIFKNPQIADNAESNGWQFIPAGKLIDESNLKGIKCGGAYVSKKHGNFIINRNKAKFYDVYELMQIIKCKIELKTNILLEEEIQILPKILEVEKWRKQKK